MWLWYTVGSKIIRKIEKSDEKSGWIMNLNGWTFLNRLFTRWGICTFTCFFKFLVPGPEGIL